MRFAIKRLTLKEICLFLLGAIVLMVWLLLGQKLSNLHLEILSIAGWVCIWEAVKIAVIERPELTRASKAFDRVISADCFFETAEGES